VLSSCIYSIVLEGHGWNIVGYRARLWGLSLLILLFDPFCRPVLSKCFLETHGSKLIASFASRLLTNQKVFPRIPSTNFPPLKSASKRGLSIMTYKQNLKKYKIEMTYILMTFWIIIQMTYLPYKYISFTKYIMSLLSLQWCHKICLVCVTYIGCKKYQNIIKAQDVDIIFKTATMTITNHQDEQRQRQQH
jgi:hypothetical protein